VCAALQNDDENGGNVLDNMRSDSSAMQTTLRHVFQILVKAAACPGGRRPSRDTAGTVLAAAVSALPVRGSWGCPDSVASVHETVLRQVVASLFQGPMPTDCAGSFKALGACWAAHACAAQEDAKLIRSSLLSIMRVLRGPSQWTVRILPSRSDHLAMLT
jgi:hypothetical protein